MSDTQIDPQDKYHTDGFAEQPQEWPGLQRDMDPVPDCGEDSYKGSGRLKGRRALVTGGDSGIGRAAAIAFAKEGANVVINYLPEEGEDAKEVVRVLEKEGVGAKGIPGDLKDEAFCRALVKQASEARGGLDILANV